MKNVSLGNVGNSIVVYLVEVSEVKFWGCLVLQQAVA